MTTELSQYLKDIKDNLRLNLSEEGEIINELKTHIEDSLQELAKSGISEEEATRTCMRLLDSAKLVARQLYEAHSQSNWWQHIGWLSILLERRLRSGNADGTH